MDEEAIIGIAIYLATDKMNKTKKKKKKNPQLTSR